MKNGAKNSIPSKLYYSISEVAQITEVKAHVLRYWESEFSTLKVKKSRTGSRRYRKVDIEEIQAIKKLLYQEGFKIAGAKKIRRQARLANQKTESAPSKQLTMGFSAMKHSEQMAFMGKELGNLLQMVRDMQVSGVEDKGTGEGQKTAGKPLKKMEGRV
ncbi:MAG: MerR family transcriptional regulator [Gemmatimonadales bacterium]|nr:MerR family transcriptional regulator [Gemmatimonadales bacterium]